MKLFNLSCVLLILTLLTGCQAIQFFDSPIPVTSNLDLISVSSVDNQFNQ